jgi:predicted ribosome quality control (RQC) complex YloA/Tae2 family protein
MSVRYDPLLTAALAGELEVRYAGEPLAALGLHGDAWTAALAFADGSVLWLFLHPRAGQIVPGEHSPLSSLLSDRAKWKKALRQSVLRADDWVWWTFRGLRVSGVESPLDERLIYVTLGEGTSDRFRIVLDLPRNRRNTLLLERPPAEAEPGTSGAGWRIRDMLRARPGRIAAGNVYSPPVGTRHGTDEMLPISEWLELVEEPDTVTDARVSPVDSALRHVAFTSALNLDYIIGESNDEANDEANEEASKDARPDEAPSDETVTAAYERYREVLESRGCWLLRRPWGLQHYVHPLGLEDAVRIDSLLDGMARAAAEEAVEAPATDHDSALAGASVVASALRRKRKRLRRRLAALGKEMEEGGAAERLRETGHLLLAHLRDVPKGAASIELTDFDGSPRKIELDPALDAAANADRYYRKAARRTRARDRLPGLIANVRREIGDVEAGLDRLAETGEPDGTLRELAELPDERPGAPVTPERLPYHRFMSASGLEIRVGRSSKDNDALTFHHSAPDDIWLHARQVPGAHVILRWNRRDQNPSERDLADAAVLAALHSDARHSGVVAVDWTRRKYVHKPRKADSGAVVADRLKTVFVEPDPEATKRLRQGA